MPLTHRNEPPLYAQYAGISTKDAHRVLYNTVHVMCVCVVLIAASWRPDYHSEPNQSTHGMKRPARKEVKSCDGYVLQTSRTPEGLRCNQVA